MSVKESWKKFGKNTGKAFTNFGKAMGTTAKIVFTNEKNDVDENGESKLKKAWKNTGKGFGDAGKSLGKASSSTAKKVFKGESQEEVKDKTVVDAEFEEVKKEEKEKDEQ